MTNTWIVLIALPLAAALLLKAFRRIQLSQAKHRSLAGHSRWSRRVAAWLPFFAIPESRWFDCDNAPREVAAQRRAGLAALVAQLTSQSPKTLTAAAALEPAVSDMQFTLAYRVPFMFRQGLPAALRRGGLAQSTEGVTITDLDGHARLDCMGSYGVNIWGYDFYKSVMAEGYAEAAALGPVLGPYHPLISEVVEGLRQISGLDEVSFHMSGTEAVMQAVRLARYHTRRSHLVRFCGAYHGWWDGVQPGVGNRRNVDDVYTLQEMSNKTLKVLDSRRDIACVLVNPLQAFHPNRDAPNDNALISGKRSTAFNRAAYREWLQQLREVCTRRGIVLIIDEVFTGFRLGMGGAQEYFDIKADMVTYGKSLGGGLPIGVVCGKREYMQRYRKDKPADVCFARGTFNSHPYVVASAAIFLRRIRHPDIQNAYHAADALFTNRAQHWNTRLAAAHLPVRVHNMHSIFTVTYLQAGRYHWLFQFYLKAEGLELAWIGTGRFIFSLNYTDADFDAVITRFINAAHRMAADGWWWHSAEVTHSWIQRQMLLGLWRGMRPSLRPAP